jgi:putative transposase
VISVTPVSPFVNTVGRDEEAIRAYIRNQEKEDQRLDQLNLWR